jgi:hypothetical protein
MSGTETNELLHAYLSTVQYEPPHMKFDPEQYQRDIEAGLIPLSRNASNSPYFPAELKAAHNAATLNVLPGAGKKRVVIATTIAHNWPAAYIERCFNAFCVTYDLWQTTTPANTTRPTIEVINLASYAPGGHGNPPLSTNPNANQNIVDALDAQINGAGNGAAIAHITTRAGLIAIPDLNETTHTDAKYPWLSELILNFWAIAMNPNAHFRVVCGNSASGYDLDNAVVYASTDSNFASNPYGTTDYVNMSWGDGTFGYDRSSLDDSFFVNPRICYFGAAGNYRSATYPATSSNVMCVGGANLLYNPGLVISAANNNPNVALWVGTNGAGGGTGFSHSVINASEAYTRPSHQFTTLAGVSDFNNGRRVCPDICSLADPVTGLTVITANNTGPVKIAKIITGGTSLATPLMCGLFSHLSQRRINEGLVPFTTRLNDIGAPLYSLSGSTNLQKLLYDSFRSNAVNTLFHDITVGTTLIPTGDNYGPNSGRTFVAGPGYDIATGLGFARMLAIENALFSASGAGTGSGAGAGTGSGAGSGSVGSGSGSVGSGSVGSSTIAPTNVPGQQRPRIVFNINVPSAPQPQ